MANPLTSYYVRERVVDPFTLSPSWERGTGRTYFPVPLPSFSYNKEGTCVDLLLCRKCEDLSLGVFTLDPKEIDLIGFITDIWEVILKLRSPYNLVCPLHKTNYAEHDEEQEKDHRERLMPWLYR